MAAEVTEGVAMVGNGREVRTEQSGSGMGSVGRERQRKKGCVGTGEDLCDGYHDS